MTPTDVITVVAAAAPLWGPLAVAATQALLHRLPTNQRAVLRDVVAVTVRGVEQMYLDKPGTGAEKKAQAEQFAATELAHLGIKVAPATLNVLIEAAVAQLPPAPAPAPQG